MVKVFVDWVIVPVYPEEIVKLATLTAVSIVAVPVPELESKTTLSVDDGKYVASGVPLLVFDQWFVASDQLPVPPTQ